MNSLVLTEKQQEVLWLRYGRRASIEQIARWLKISRRAVLSRPSNARRRTQRAGLAFPESNKLLAASKKSRLFSASQIATNGDESRITDGRTLISRRRNHPAGVRPRRGMPARAIGDRIGRGLGVHRPWSVQPIGWLFVIRTAGILRGVANIHVAVVINQRDEFLGFLALRRSTNVQPVE